MLLQVENLEVKYGNIQALHGISFHVNEGEIVTLIGANGAGKTTSLYSITRLPPPEAPPPASPPSATSFTSPLPWAAW